ncbi:hypothetical protein K9M48_02555 [Candidatus Gracilibacteria bacterium]|nr:hypothetical protein [Candidatus Gracilibacteria bacterium]
MKHIDKILESGNTVFKANEFALLLDITNKNTLKTLIQRLKKSRIIIYHGGGLRSLKKYDSYELASKIKSKSYISLETVLQKEGIIFQDYGNTVTLISDKSFEKIIDTRKYSFSKIKDTILLNTIGIKDMGKYMMASKERAICDRIYLTPSYYFDNLGNLNTKLLEKLSTIYNKSTNLRIKKLLHDNK